MITLLVKGAVMLLDGTEGLDSLFTTARGCLLDRRLIAIQREL